MTRSKVTPEQKLPKEQEAQEEKSLPVSNSLRGIDIAPQDGTNIIVMEKPEDNGVMAYWRKTRVREGNGWKPKGRWSNPLTHMAIGFEPKYWRDEEAVEYKMDASIADKARISELEQKVRELSRTR